MDINHITKYSKKRFHIQSLQLVPLFVEILLQIPTSTIELIIFEILACRITNDHHIKTARWWKASKYGASYISGGIDLALIGCEVLKADDVERFHCASVRFIDEQLPSNGERSLAYIHTHTQKKNEGD